VAAAIAESRGQGKLIRETPSGVPQQMPFETPQRA
jgi:hypothetical protein